MPQSPTSENCPVADQSQARPKPDETGHPRLLRVTCPQGHKLDAPCVLHGQDVVCPYCGDRFLFSYERSEEFQQEHTAPEDSSRPARSDWLSWVALSATVAITGAIVLQWISRWH